MKESVPAVNISSLFTDLSRVTKDKIDKKGNKNKLGVFALYYKTNALFDSERETAK